MAQATGMNEKSPEENTKKVRTRYGSLKGRCANRNSPKDPVVASLAPHPESRFWNLHPGRSQTI